jgi:hypothetical protein
MGGWIVCDDYIEWLQCGIHEEWRVDRGRRNLSLMRTPRQRMKKGPIGLAGDQLGPFNREKVASPVAGMRRLGEAAESSKIHGASWTLR